MSLGKKPPRAALVPWVPILGTNTRPRRTSPSQSPPTPGPRVKGDRKIVWVWPRAELCPTTPSIPSHPKSDPRGEISFSLSLSHTFTAWTGGEEVFLHRSLFAAWHRGDRGMGHLSGSPPYSCTPKPCCGGTPPSRQHTQGPARRTPRQNPALYFESKGSVAKSSS